MIRSSVHRISDRDLRYLSTLFHCRTDGPRLAPWEGFFLTAWIDRTSYLSLFNCRLLSDGCTHLPQVQETMPAPQYQEQAGHCILVEISHSSRCSVSPMLVINSFDFSLNGLNSSVLFKSFIKLGWFSNCLNQSFYEFFVIRVFFLNCWVSSLFQISFQLESSFWTVEWGEPWIL